MFIDRKTHYCSDVNSARCNVQIQCIPNQNPALLFYRYRQTKVYMDRHKTQNSQHNTEEEQV